MFAVGGLVALGAGLVIGAPIAVAAPSPEAIDAINDRYDDFGGATSLLGTPVGEATEIPGGAEQDYRGGAIFFSEGTGAKIMYGAILDKYRSLGGPTSDLGFPTNDESDPGGGVGRFNDFSEAGGAAIYWNPQAGAWVVKGRVLDAWRESGAIKGPFGYPSADMTVTNGVSTGKFVGPAGTEIQWSESGGLSTVPAALAATLPGFGAASPSIEGTMSVPTPSVSAPSTDTSTNNNKWWGVPVGLAIAAAAGGLLGLLGRRRGPDVTAPTGAALPNFKLPEATTPTVKAPPGFTAPQVKAPEVKAPEVKAPRVKAPEPPRFTAPAPAVPIVDPPKGQAPPGSTSRHSLLGENTQLTDDRLVDATRKQQPLVVDYENNGPAGGGGIDVTYENNAIGVNQHSADDKSDQARDRRT